MNNKISIKSNEIVPIDTKNDNFKTLMNIYETAMFQVKDELDVVKDNLNSSNNYDVINTINYRLKNPDSILEKMERKNYGLNYNNLIRNINDVAGIRVVCPFKSDIIKIKESIENIDNIEILEEKDYITNPKKSGYSGFHIIVQTPVMVGNNQAKVKTEIQIRTMAMDFWATTEHKIKYKAKSKISKIDARKMRRYSTVINVLDDKINNINKKYK